MTHVCFYFDVHISSAIAREVRKRGVDVLTAQEDNSARLPDDLLLERATQLGRTLVTHDVRFRALAELWQRQGRHFAGLVFAPLQDTPPGPFVFSLEAIAFASSPEEMANHVQWIPL